MKANVLFILFEALVGTKKGIGTRYLRFIAAFSTTYGQRFNSRRFLTIIYVTVMLTSSFSILMYRQLLFIKFNSFGRRR